MEVEKSKKDGEFAGLLHIRILEAKKLLVDRISSNANPYCIVTAGPHEVFTTNAVKRGKITTWNEFFELLVKKQKEKKVEVTVMARDTVNGDDFLGMAIVDFTDFGKETRGILLCVPFCCG
jgi:Ca2+-dependent lipid-binding protein